MMKKGRHPPPGISGLAEKKFHLSTVPGPGTVENGLLELVPARSKVGCHLSNFKKVQFRRCKLLSNFKTVNNCTNRTTTVKLLLQVRYCYI